MIWSRTSPHRAADVPQHARCIDIQTAINITKTAQSWAALGHVSLPGYIQFIPECDGRTVKFYTLETLARNAAMPVQKLVTFCSEELQ